MMMKETSSSSSSFNRGGGGEGGSNILDGVDDNNDDDDEFFDEILSLNHDTQGNKSDDESLMLDDWERGRFSSSWPREMEKHYLPLKLLWRHRHPRYSSSGRPKLPRTSGAAATAATEERNVNAIRTSTAASNLCAIIAVDISRAQSAGKAIAGVIGPNEEAGVEDGVVLFRARWPLRHRRAAMGQQELRASLTAALSSLLCTKIFVYTSPVSKIKETETCEEYAGGDRVRGGGRTRDERGGKRRGSGQWLTLYVVMERDRVLTSERGGTSYLEQIGNTIQQTLIMWSRSPLA